MKKKEKKIKVGVKIKIGKRMEIEWIKKWNEKEQKTKGNQENYCVEDKTLNKVLHIYRKDNNNTSQQKKGKAKTKNKFPEKKRKQIE